MKKRIIAYAAAAMLMFTASAGAMQIEYDGAVHEYTGSLYRLVINGEVVRTPLEPIIFNERTLVPVREVFEKVGASVDYDGGDQSVSITYGDTNVVVRINDNVAYVNGKMTLIPDGLVPKLITKVGGETKTMVPLRFIGEVAGMIVDFDPDTSSVILRTEDGSDYIPPVTPTQAPVQIQRPAENLTPNAGGNTAEQPQPTVDPLKTAPRKRVVVIDAGHGSQDRGAVGSLDGQVIKEDDITLAIARKVNAILRSNGVETIMTRESDLCTTLTARSNIANQAQAALFLSIHINSYEESGPNGTEVYYAASNNSANFGTTSRQFAQNVLNGMLKYMGSKSRGVKTAEHVVTRTSYMPAVLAEVGFISNPDELRKMLSEDYQNKAAQGIAEGIMNTLNNVTIGG